VEVVVFGLQVKEIRRKISDSVESIGTNAIGLIDPRWRRPPDVGTLDRASRLVRLIREGAMPDRPVE